MESNKRQAVIKDLELIREVFAKYNVPFFLVYGIVLGFHRDGDFLPEDDDIDLAVFEPIDLETRKKIGWALSDLGFTPQPVLFNVFGRMELGEEGYNGDETSGIVVCERNIKITIFFFKEETCEKHGQEYVCVPKLGACKLISTPAKFYENHGYIKINRKKYFAPKPIEEYLAYCYGDGTNGHNWRNKTDRWHSPTYPEAHE